MGIAYVRTSLQKKAFESGTFAMFLYATSLTCMHVSVIYGVEFHLRCPETLFISHEHANFLFSVFRVVQGEAKTTKTMGCCRANFAFLHALKFGTFRGK